MDADDLHLLRLAIDEARRAREAGDHPFGAVLVSPAGQVLARAGNTVTTTGDVTGHAELNLLRQASVTIPAGALAGCTIYSSAEPCAMCAGAIYWSGIGRVVYALPEAELRRLTGADAENPTMNLPARQVLGAGQRDVVVEGPVDLPEAVAVHEGFWDPGRTSRA